MSEKLWPEAGANPDFAKMEEGVLESWRAGDVFARSVSLRDGSPEFVFYDGPPFANGLPHYGHLVTGYVKDIVPRYKTMRGYKVERRFGWDCHGLPAELQTEKEIGISGRMDILEYGVDRFNSACHESVLRFTKDWERYVDRQGRWVDFQNDYKTLDPSYMESVMWAFRQLWDKGLIYEDYRVVPYSWAVESPLSNFETRLDNAYRMRQDPAVTVAFRLREPLLGKTAYLLAWTTTPWTLPSNLALAVGADIDYAVLEAPDGTLAVLASDRLGAYAKELTGAPVATLKGRDLEGLGFEPLFPYFKDTENAFRVLTADFVSTEDGTGIVHLAPGFGEEDLNVCRSAGISVVVPVDNRGRFTAEVPDYEGELVFDANKLVIRDLKARGVLIRQETIDHNYPHCWRTDTPLIYKAINSWYLAVSRFRDRMAELNRETISWVPANVRDGQFGKWLENARDWNIGRNRFWGAPIPVWKSDDPAYPRVDVYGSIAELERDFGGTVTDLHRPGIDALTRPNPDDPTGKSTMRRVEDVLDCWFESGSMPYAQVHYPFENKEWFENHFPGDFIVEYIAQTRGWFYTLMVLSTALFDRAPFRNCICHGVVLDENHQKLSKRLRNYPDPLEVFDTYGSDALRWFLVSTPLMQGGDLAIPRDGKAIGQTRNQILNPIWNAWSFFTLYANADGARANLIETSDNVIDRYILAKTRALVDSVTARMEAYDLPSACHAIWQFLDALTNWYIRRSRDRFWRAEKDADKQAAYDTLYTVLHNLTRVSAPFLPFLSETIYRGLTGEESVHFAPWPDPLSLPEDQALVSAMDRVREVCSATLSIREKENLRVRLPLAELVVAGADSESLAPYVDLIRDEVNVKSVTLSNDPARFGRLILKVHPAIGKRVGSKIKDVMSAAAQGAWTAEEDGTIHVAGEVLAEGEFVLSLSVGEGLCAQTLNTSAGGGQGAVILDTRLTPALEREGLARDLVRLIQQTRKEADFAITDRIDLVVCVPAGFAESAREHMAFIQSETLAESLSIVPEQSGDSSFFHLTHDVSGEKITIAVRVRSMMGAGESPKATRLA